MSDLIEWIGLVFGAIGVVAVFMFSILISCLPYAAVTVLVLTITQVYYHPLYMELVKHFYTFIGWF